MIPRAGRLHGSAVAELELLARSARAGSVARCLRPLVAHDGRLPGDQGYLIFNAGDHYSWVRGPHTFKFGVDWEWMEQQIRHMRSIKIPHPVIVVHANGAIGTGTVDPGDAKNLPAVKSIEHEVIVADDVGNVTDYSIWTWADLRAGKLFDEP